MEAAAAYPRKSQNARVRNTIGIFVGIALVALLVAYVATDIYTYTANVDALALAGK